MLCKGSQRPGFIYKNTNLKKARAYMGSLCLGILSSGRFCQQGEEGVSLAQSTLTRVEFLCRSLCWTGGWCWGAGPWLPGGIWFPAASLHGACSIWNHLLSPVPHSLEAWRSEILFDLGYDFGRPERGAGSPKHGAWLQPIKPSISHSDNPVWARTSSDCIPGYPEPPVGHRLAYII